MTQQVAVRSFEDMVNHFDKLKRDALFFDRIAVSELTTKAAAWASQSDYTSVEAQKLADLPWLVDQGILFDPNTTLNDRDLMDIAVHRDYLNARAAVQDQLHTLIGRLTGDEPKDRTLVVDPNRMEVNAGLSSQECNTRIDAALMRDLGVNALALLTTLPGPVSWRRTAPIDVMHIAVAGLPMPANTVSWQTLQELRADNESKSKLKRLRAWITDVATREQSLKQIVEALKDLFSDYHGYLQGRSVTVRFFSIGTIVVVSRMLAEGFGKGEKIKSNLARIRHSREPLMESEVGDVGAWVMHYEPSHMSNPLSEADAERLSNARVSVADEHNLIQYYELGKFLRLPSFDQVQSGQTRNRRLKINHWADKAYRTYSPEVKNKITIEENRKRFKKAFEEHEHSSTELLGDYPRKLKKWALYVFSDYAEQLAEVAFAMFRLDELNACALLLPSGIPAVILNASLLTSVPFIVSAFMGLYDKLFARDKREPKSQAPEIGFVIDMARAFASRNYEEVTKLQRSFASIGRANLYVDINFNWSLFVALHECAHIILNHLSSSAAANTEVSGIKLLVRSQQLEYAADEFAIRHWLFVDPEPDADHAFKIAATCTCVFAFFQLISNISSERIDSHPQATYRWTAVRPHLLSINGAEPLVKKCEEMISMISTVQQFT